jgi:hypothetical protein
MGSEGIAPPFLTSAVYGGEWLASLTSRIILGEGAPGTNWIGGWLGRRAGMDALEKKKIFFPCRESTPIVEPLARRYADRGISAAPLKTPFYSSVSWSNMHDSLSRLSEKSLPRVSIRPLISARFEELCYSFCAPKVSVFFWQMRKRPYKQTTCMYVCVVYPPCCICLHKGDFSSLRDTLLLSTRLNTHV